MTEAEATAAVLVPTRAPCRVDGAVAGFATIRRGETIELDMARGET